MIPLRVTVAWAPAAREVVEVTLLLPPGATVRDAVDAAACQTSFDRQDVFAMPPGIWGRVAAWGDALRDLDRIELCRPLLVDPKVARRERFRRQGMRGTGLFARKRSDGKAGY